MAFLSCKRCGYRTTADFVADSGGKVRPVGAGTCPNCGAPLETAAVERGIWGGTAATGGALGAAALLIYLIVKVLIPALSGMGERPDAPTATRHRPWLGKLGALGHPGSTDMRPHEAPYAERSDHRHPWENGKTSS